MIPSPWEFGLLVLAVYRAWRLIAADTILDRPRAWLLGVPGWKPTGHETPPEGYREHLAIFLTCPYCLGAHITVVAWLAWLYQPDITLIAATPWALSGAVALVVVHLDP